MSIECGECERDLRGGHAPDCSRNTRTTELTSGEKIVWAAVYAKYWTGHGFETPAAVENAWAAVMDMRESRKAVLDGWGVGEQLEMLDEMLAEDQS